MCLDGQLWPLVHLAPFASHLHPMTLRRILPSSQLFLTSLSLRGMDHLAGSDLMLALSAPGTNLNNLLNIDLRGCKRLNSTDLVVFLSSTPNLRTANLKGLQAVSSEVMRTIARTALNLENLDVSRCWNISLSDLVVFLKMMIPSQAGRMNSLRVAGAKGYGIISGEFLPLVADRLVNLHTLDLLGCSHLFDEDFERFADVPRTQNRVFTLQHLIISGCSSLGMETFLHLTGKMPNLIKLEAAGLRHAHRRSAGGVQWLINFLKTVPKLQKLDLEDTGSFGGIDDRVLEILTPPKGVSGIVGSELVELYLGYAQGVSSNALIRLVRGCTKLMKLEVDVSILSHVWSV